MSLNMFPYIGNYLTELTDNSTGTSSDTVADAGTTYVEATINNNFAVLANKINEIIEALNKANGGS